MLTDFFTINIKINILNYFYILIHRNHNIWKKKFSSLIVKIPKAYSEVGTSRGDEPIIDQSCGAAVFFPDRTYRDLSASNLPVPIQWIYDPVLPEILAILKTPS